MSTQSTHLTRKIIAIVKPELVAFVKLLGISEVYEAMDSNKALEILENNLKRNDVGIIVVQKSLVNRISEDVQGRVYPIILFLPDTPLDISKSSIEEYRKLVKRIIGYEIHVT